jgi:hypothetical protein
MPLAYGRKSKSKSTTEPTPDTLQSEAQAPAAQQFSASIPLSSGKKSRLQSPCLVLANAPQVNRTVMEDFATSHTSPMEDAAVDLSFGKDSRDYPSPTTSANASQGPRASRNAGASSQQAAAVPHSASPWLSFGEDDHVASSPFASTNTWPAARANMLEDAPPPSSSMQQFAPASSGPFSCKKSRSLSSSLASTNAMPDARSIMEEDEYATSPPVSMPQTASSWSSVGGGFRVTMSYFSSTNAFPATRANMGVDESDEFELNKHHSPLQHPGIQLQSAASQLSAAQSTTYATPLALGMIATGPFLLEPANASPAARAKTAEDSYRSAGLRTYNPDEQRSAYNSYSGIGMSFIYLFPTA